MFFVGRRSNYFQRLCWEKVSSQQPSLLTPIQEIIVNALERERSKTLPIESGKLERDKVFTCINNIKQVQKKYIFTCTFGTEHSPCIIFFKLCVNM